MMLNLQNVLDQTRQESAVDLGYGIRCQTRPRDGQMSVEYWPRRTWLPICRHASTWHRPRAWEPST